MHDIDLTVSVDQPMPDAQDRILDRVDHRLRGAGYTDRARAHAHAHAELTEALGGN